jgi:hypothetical protein
LLGRGRVSRQCRGGRVSGGAKFRVVERWLVGGRARRPGT